MSSNGTLIAYSVPANIKQVRDQAALMSMTLNDSAVQSPNAQDPVQVLTVQVDSRNILAKRVQPDLFVVLVGGVPPHVSSNFHVKAERAGDPPCSPIRSNDDLSEVMRQTQALQRTRLDALCDFVQSEIGECIKE